MMQTTHEWTLLLGAHVLAAFLSLVIGAAQLIRRPKGDRPHRIVGRVWIVLMYFTASSSLSLQLLIPGQFSPIHGLSVLTLITLSLGWWFARHGNARAHAANMIGSYIGVWGAFIGAVVVPDRLIPQAFASDWLGMTVVTAGVVAIGLGGVALIARMLPEPDLTA